MNKASHEEVQELIAPFALGAVSPDEEVLVRSHLRECDDCSRELERHSSVTASLASAVDPVPLPSGFVERTLARLESERGERKESPAPQPRRRGRLAWLLAGASALIAAAVIAVIAVGGGGVTDADNVAALLQRPGLELSGDGVEAKVVETDEGTMFVARGLDPPPEGRVYALWEMSEGCAPNAHGPCITRPAGTFDEVTQGRAVVDFEGDLDEIEAAGVTIEEGRVEEPTSAPILTSL